MFTRLGLKFDKYTYAMDGGMETCLAHVLHYLWEIFFLGLNDYLCYLDRIVSCLSLEFSSRGSTIKVRY